jgi:hypothetical protein
MACFARRVAANEDDRGQAWTTADDVWKTQNRRNVVVRGGIEPPT